MDEQFRVMFWIISLAFAALRDISMIVSLSITAFIGQKPVGIMDWVDTIRTVYDRLTGR